MGHCATWLLSRITHSWSVIAGYSNINVTLRINTEKFGENYKRGWEANMIRRLTLNRHCWFQWLALIWQGYWDPATHNYASCLHSGASSQVDVGRSHHNQHLSIPAVESEGHGFVFSETKSTLNWTSVSCQRISPDVASQFQMSNVKTAIVFNFTS